MSDLVVIWSMEHKAWWRAKSQGYCINLSKAGLYDRKEAQRIVDSSHGENERIVELDEAFTKLQSQAFEADMALSSIRIGVDQQVSNIRLLERT